MSGLFTGFALLDWPNQNKWKFSVDVFFAALVMAATFMTPEGKNDANS